ncbi:hypothetical protein F4775DRAFT_52357 [Biscogniauxia sp. FL1348]|nr:hypothetical protein F4775DRAFT_52357 [Biscogniauxia sp. FL1348]
MNLAIMTAIAMFDSSEKKISSPGLRDIPQGVPKSNRCTFCKKRKTKCDEKWPTCGACARAKVVCSGARNKFKFVVNGCHNESATTASPYPAPHPATIATTSSILTSAPTFAVTAPTLLAGDHSGNYRSDKTMAGRVRSINTTANKKTAKKQGHRHHLANAVVDMHEHSKGGCCTLQRMRLPPSSTFSPYAPYTRTITSTRALAPFCPFPSAGVPMSAAALLAARFVRCLDAAPCTGNDLQLMGSALRMIPQQLILGGSSPSPSTNHIHTSSRSGREKREISGGMGSVVLHHVVELVVASWSNSRRGLPPSSWLDLKAYGSALRSLQGAVTAQMDGLGLTHTLAALALLQKVEVSLPP